MMRYLPVFGILLLLSQISCSPLSQQPIVWRDTSINLVWPTPPAQPRIRYLRSLSGTDNFSEEDKATRFFHWLSGEQQRQIRLVSPFDVVADGRGRIWVTDTLLRGIVCFDLQQGSVSLLNSFSGRKLSMPTGIAYDAANDRLYVADAVQNKVLVLSADGRYLGERNPPDGYGRPADVELGADNTLYVADVLKHRVVVFDREGGVQEKIEGRQPPFYAFNRPNFLAVDHERNLLVTDSMNFRVEIFPPDRQGGWVVGRIGDGPGSFSRPRGVAVDSERHIYVVDAMFGNVQVFDSTGQLLIFFGQPGRGPAEFSLPSGIFCDISNRLYVVDTYNQRIQIFEYIPESL